jgi:hypothetical protein
MTLGILGCEALNGPFPFLVVISDMKYPLVISHLVEHLNLKEI